MTVAQEGGERTRGAKSATTQTASDRGTNSADKHTIVAAAAALFYVAITPLPEQCAGDTRDATGATATIRCPKDT